jgi:hypothetical protein
MHLKLSEKQEQAKHKNSKQKEILKIGTEILTKWRLKENYKELLKKRWFFEKINNIDRSVAKLTKRKMEKTQINKIRDEKRDSTTNANEIQRLIREYFKNLYSNILEDLEE